MSTGPITPEGKSASRRNALTHGLTASEVMPEADREAVERRKAEWRRGYQIETEEAEWAFEVLVAQSVQLDRCREKEDMVRQEEMRRARLSWDDDRRLEADALGESLAKSRRPGAVCLRLKQTRQGVEWLIACWAGLGRAFEQNGAWDEAQAALVLDLIGVLPALRAASLANADPAALVACQLADLERRLEALSVLDEFARQAAAAGSPTTTSRELTNLRRYEAACWREFHRAEAKLQPFRLAHPLPPAAPEPPKSSQPAPEAPRKNEAIGDLDKMGDPPGPAQTDAAVDPRPTPAYTTIMTPPVQAQGDNAPRSEGPRPSGNVVAGPTPPTAPMPLPC